MAEKKAFVLRINPEMLKELEAWAQQDFRSLNGQIEYLLSDALKKQKRSRSKDVKLDPEEGN
ncbi:MAG: Arc family DNA-binding protein [Dyadobacter sp.]